MSGGIINHELQLTEGNVCHTFANLLYSEIERKKICNVERVVPELNSDIATSMRIRRIRNIASKYKEPVTINIKCKSDNDYPNDDSISFMVSRDASYKEIKLINSFCDTFNDNKINIDRDNPNIYYRTGYSTMLYACPCSVITIQLANIDNSKKYNIFAENQFTYVDLCVEAIEKYIDLIKLIRHGKCRSISR